MKKNILPSLFIAVIISLSTFNSFAQEFKWFSELDGRGELYQLNVIDSMNFIATFKTKNNRLSRYHEVIDFKNDRLISSTKMDLSTMELFKSYSNHFGIDNKIYNVDVEKEKENYIYSISELNNDHYNDKIEIFRTSEKKCWGGSVSDREYPNAIILVSNNFYYQSEIEGFGYKALDKSSLKINIERDFLLPENCFLSSKEMYFFDDRILTSYCTHVDKKNSISSLFLFDDKFQTFNEQIIENEADFNFVNSDIFVLGEDTLLYTISKSVNDNEISKFSVYGLDLTNNTHKLLFSREMADKLFYWASSIEISTDENGDCYITTFLKIPPSAIVNPSENTVICKISSLSDFEWFKVIYTDNTMPYGERTTLNEDKLEIVNFLSEREVKSLLGLDVKLKLVERAIVLTEVDLQTGETSHRMDGTISLAYEEYLYHKVYIWDNYTGYIFADDKSYKLGTKESFGEE